MSPWEVAEERTQAQHSSAGRGDHSSSRSHEPKHKLHNNNTHTRITHISTHAHAYIYTHTHKHTHTVRSHFGADLRRSSHTQILAVAMFGFTKEKATAAGLEGLFHSQGAPDPTTKSLWEFTPLRQRHPWKFFFHAIAALWKFTSGEIIEAELLAEQNTLPKEIFDKARSDFQAHREQIKEFQAHLYDPSAQICSTILMQVLGRLKQVTKLHEQNFKIFVASSGAIAVLLSVFMLRSWWIAEKFAEVVPFATFDLQFAQQFFGVLIVLFVAKEILEIKSVLKFNLMEIGRMRLSTTTGDLVQILMRLEMKLSYVELRTMEFEGKIHHFRRHFRQDVLEVVWNQQERGLREG